MWDRVVNSTVIQHSGRRLRCRLFAYGGTNFRVWCKTEMRIIEVRICSYMESFNTNLFFFILYTGALTKFMCIKTPLNIKFKQNSR